MEDKSWGVKGTAFTVTRKDGMVRAVTLATFLITIKNVFTSTI